MGTRLVYDYQQQKWIPYVSDPNKWNQHLLDVRDGYAERDSQGHYIVGSGRKYREVKEMRQKEKPVVNLITPVAQALEMAKFELKRKGEDRVRARSEVCQALTGKRHLDPIHYIPGNPQYRLLHIRVHSINERPPSCI